MTAFATPSTTTTLWVPRPVIEVVLALAIHSDNLNTPDRVAATHRLNSALDIPAPDIAVSLTDLTLVFTAYSQLDSTSQADVAESILGFVDGHDSLGDLMTTLCTLQAVMASSPLATNRTDPASRTYPR